MKNLLKFVVYLAALALLILLAFRITGLNPKNRRPGLWLSGEVATAPVTDWSFVSQYPTDQVQTRTWYLLPHSVNTDFVVVNGQLYITSIFPANMPYPEGKSWTASVVRDPHVRLKFGNQLFDRVLVPVTDPAEKLAAVQAAGVKYHALIVANANNGSTMYLFHALPE